MKRLNYYKVHKNKNPKIIKRIKPNSLQIQLSLLTMSSFVQNSIIISQNFKSLAEKHLALVNNITNHVEKLQSIIKQEKSNRYLKKRI